MLLHFIRTHPALTLLIVFGIGFLLLHVIFYIRPSAIASPAALAAQISAGRPVLLEVYSNL